MENKFIPKKKYKILLWLIFFIAMILIVPLLWYTAPSIIRTTYYKKHSAGVYERLIEDCQFDITVQGESQTYQFDNEYVIPFAIEWHIIQKNGADIPDNPTRYQSYKMKVKAELLIDDKTISTFINQKDIPLGYSKNLRTKEESRYFPILRCNYPLRCKFNSNCKLRITVVETDSRLKGLKGVLVVKPDTTL